MEKIDNKSTLKSKLKKNIKLNFNKKNIIAIGIILIILYLGVVIAFKRYSIVEYEKQRIKLENELESKQKEIEELETMIKNAEDPKFIEKVARENLKMVKPNETVYIVNK